MTVVDLTTKRFERLERAQRETNAHLERVIDILEVHSNHFERVEEALLGISAAVDRVNERIDRQVDRIDLLVGAIARGRTQDLARFADHERRIRDLERKRRVRRPR